MPGLKQKVIVAGKRSTRGNASDNERGILSRHRDIRQRQVEKTAVVATTCIVAQHCLCTATSGMLIKDACNCCAHGTRCRTVTLGHMQLIS